MNVKNNRRAQETRQRIQTALLELLEEQPLDQVSVSQLCKRAEVNRSTFYARYDDVIALMEEIERSIGGEVIKELEPYFSTGENLLPKAFLHSVYENIARHQTFYRSYLHSVYGRERMQWGFAQLLGRTVRPLMHQLGVTDDALVQYYFDFFQEGMLAVTRRWVDRGCAESVETICKIIANMAAHPSLQL